MKNTTANSTMKIAGTQLEAQSGLAHFWSDISKGWEDIATGSPGCDIWIPFTPLAQEALDSVGEDRAAISAYIEPRQADYSAKVKAVRKSNGWPA